MNKGLPQLKEHPIKAGHIKMINHYLKSDNISAYVREILTKILKRGSFNKTDRSILSDLRDKYMIYLKENGGNVIEYVIGVNPSNTTEPIQSFDNLAEASLVTDVYKVIYAKTKQEAIESYIEQMKNWDE